MKTYYGIKKGMTQTWTKSGLRLPVTIIKVEPMIATQIKTTDSDGYTAVQVGIGTRSKKNITKPILAHLAKSKATPKVIREIRLDTASELTTGDVITIDQIVGLGDKVKVTSDSRGRGFGGVMQRWSFKGGPKTHGQSDRWRAAGSIGQGTSPGRVHKGKKMAGRYGGETYTIKNLQVIKIDPTTNEIWVNGPVSGGRNTLVEIEVTKTGVTFEGLREEAVKVVELPATEIINVPVLSEVEGSTDTATEEQI